MKCQIYGKRLINKRPIKINIVDGSEEMKKKILLGILIILDVVLALTGCQKITQESVDKQSHRWWVIYYKMLEDEIPGQTSELISVDSEGGVDKILEDEFGISFLEVWNNPDTSIKIRYHYTKRRNELMEEALIKLKGKEALREIEGKYSLEEVPDLWEKVNNATGGGDRNGMLEKLLESIDSGNYENFKKDLDYDLKEKFTEEEFNKLVNEVKEKYGEYKIYSTEFISSSTGSMITTAYFYTIYSKNQKVKIMIKFSLEIEIHKIADFRFGS